MTGQTQPSVASPQRALDDLLDELAARIQAGGFVDVEALIREHPENASELRRVLPAMQVLAGLQGSGSETTAGGPLGELGDFLLIREHGRGGMGVVYEAEQRSLRRKVALKVLPWAAAMDPKQLQRFKNEALAAASLKHDHIVSVYAVGCERGVHYYAMEFVEGQTLAGLIYARLEPRDRPEDGPGSITGPYLGTLAQSDVPNADTKPVAAGRTALSAAKKREFYRQSADLIADAADALEHAHSLGIVHRDIKPGNLLVDVVGKVYVSDFGLARFGPDAGLTMSGDLLGTLRYMSPEQALARHGLVDHRTDVYSLGATLYELLTLRPAVDGKDKADILRRLAFEEPVAPRKLDKAIPAELETITLKCLAKNPAERYATAGELAADLRRYAEDKPIKARRPTVLQRFGRWARRHPGVAAAVGLIAGLLVAGSWAWHREVNNAEIAARAVAEEADRFRDADRLPEALLAARRAADLLPRFGGNAALRREVEERVADLGLLCRLEVANLEGAAVQAAENRFDQERSVPLYRHAFREYGIDVLGGDELATAEALKQRAIRVQIAATLDHWSRFTKDREERGRLGRLVAAMDGASEDINARIRRAVRARNTAALRRLAAEAETNPPAEDVIFRLGRALRDSGLKAEAMRLSSSGHHRYPGSFWINELLADMLEASDPPQLAESLRFYEAALAIRPNSPGIWLNLGNALNRLGRATEAESACLRAIDIQPYYAQAYINLANMLRKRGKPDEALTLYRRAAEVQPNSAVAQRELAIFLSESRRYADAVIAFRRALALRPDDARSHVNLGQTFLQMGLYPQALAEAKRAIELAPDQFESVGVYGAALDDSGQHREAVDYLRRAAALRPDDYRPHTNLSRALSNAGRSTEAEEAARRAIELAPNQSEGYHNLGAALVRQGRFSQALVSCRRAQELIKTQQPNYVAELARDVRTVEQLVALDAKLPDVLAGKVKPAHAAEQIELAKLCSEYKKLNAAAARFYAEALAAEPKLADDMKHAHRYNAACAAALAGCGQGQDADKLDDAERAKLRRQTLDWLTADLAAWAKMADKAETRPKVQKSMQHWQQDPDLAGVRDAAALAKLPEAERAAWQKLWAGAADLSKHPKAPEAAPAPP
jgi:serine/threonine protein kinase/Flp pilus assembly protein TadD